MPKVQLIFILHVSTYRSVFPLRLLPCWCVSCPESCVWAGNGHLLSRSLARWIQRREKPDLPQHRPETLQPCVLQSSRLPRPGGSVQPVLYRVRGCLQLCPWAVGRLWERCSEGAQRDNGARLGSVFRFPAVAPSLRGRCPFTRHSGNGTNAHSGVFLFFFLCSLWPFGFHASRESEGGVCGYDLNLICMLLNTWSMVDGTTTLNSWGFFCVLFCGCSYVAARPSLPLHAYMLSCSLIVIWVNYSSA